jgi:hypothetical protein
MAIILKANKVNLFVSSVLFVFWYNSPNFLDTPRKTKQQIMSVGFGQRDVSSRSHHQSTLLTHVRDLRPADLEYCRAEVGPPWR